MDQEKRSKITKTVINIVLGFILGVMLSMGMFACSLKAQTDNVNNNAQVSTTIETPAN